MRWLAILIGVVMSAVSARAETVTVSAAISLKESMEQIGRAYEATTGDVVRFNFDASGRLAQQVRQGAPVDAFVSAADREVDALAKDKLVDVGTRRTVAGNALVLVVPADGKGGPTSLADLARTTGKVAVGDPRSVPAGLYAEQTLTNLKLTDAVRPRLVLGQNVRQVLTYVRRGEVEAGLVYATDAKSAGDAVRVVATADADTHDAIEYPAVVVTNSAHAAAAKRFLDHLATPAARAVLQKQGFTVPEQK